mgnify:FL=1
MCIAILKPEGEKIVKNRLDTCFFNNDDGAGYMYAKNGILHFFKGFFNFGDFWKSYSKNVVRNGNPMAAIHFRITTHGKTNVNNCHPFKINENLGFIHNGIIDMVKPDVKRSDTSMFNELVLKNLPKGFIKNPAISSLIEESIGASKLVFLDNHGNYLISNESLGKWDGNVWFSNTTYCYKYKYHGNNYVYGNYNNTYYLKKDEKKDKKPKKNTELYVSCSSCGESLSTRFEQNLGICESCKDYPVYNR